MILDGSYNISAIKVYLQSWIVPATEFLTIILEKLLCLIFEFRQSYMYYFFSL